MIQSKYLDRFNLLAKEGAGTFELIGDHILVERIPIVEKRTAGGLILSLESNGNQKTA